MEPGIIREERGMEGVFTGNCGNKRLFVVFYNFSCVSFLQSMPENMPCWA
jgi:hypothetical protein